MDNRKLLSLCIPIYNRKAYLERMLSRFYEDKDLFQEKIELIISDNDSKDDLESVVNSFKKKGLVLYYYRQKENIKADGNFLFCFGKASGKYCWLLGSDDIPVKGFLRYLISELEKDVDYGLVFIQLHQPNKWFNRVKTEKVFSEIISDNQKMISDISIWITFMSSSIVRSDFIKTIDLQKYRGTSLIQVPLYVKSCLSSEKNLLVTYNYCFEPDEQNAAAGGYNFYGVFVDNLFSIMQEFVDEGSLSKAYYERFKRIEFDYYLISNTKSIFIDKKDKIHKVEGAFQILWKHYGRKIYSYLDLMKYLVARPIAKLIGK